MKKLLDIGDKGYLVSKHFAGKGLKGGKVLPARVRTYQNISGTVEPVFQSPGIRYDLTLSQYEYFDDIKEAVKSIESKK